MLPRWFIFQKAGEKGWKALIPFYGKYTLFKLFWNTNMFWASLALAIKITFLNTIAAYLLIGFAGCLIVLEFHVTAPFLCAVIVIFFCMSIAIMTATVPYVFVYVRLMHKMSRSFGHGVPFTLGTIFLRPIFYFIMAFDKSVYTKIEE